MSIYNLLKQAIDKTNNKSSPHIMDIIVKCVRMR